MCKAGDLHSGGVQFFGDIMAGCLAIHRCRLQRMTSCTSSQQPIHQRGIRRSSGRRHRLHSSPRQAHDTARYRSPPVPSPRDRQYPQQHRCGCGPASVATDAAGIIGIEITAINARLDPPRHLISSAASGSISASRLRNRCSTARRAERGPSPGRRAMRRSTDQGVFHHASLYRREVTSPPAIKSAGQVPAAMAARRYSFIFSLRAASTLARAHSWQ